MPKAKPFGMYHLKLPIIAQILIDFSDRYALLYVRKLRIFVHLNEHKIQILEWRYVWL